MTNEQIAKRIREIARSADVRRVWIGASLRSIADQLERQGVEANRILIGMSRQEWAAWLEKHFPENPHDGDPQGTAEYRARTIPALRQRWLSGEFDTPVYASREEIMDRIAARGLGSDKTAGVAAPDDEKPVKIARSNAEFYFHDFAQDTDDGTVHMSLHAESAASKIVNMQLKFCQAIKLRDNLNSVIEKINATAEVAAPDGEKAEAPARKPKCMTCGKPATCYGKYEGVEGYSCDNCCGHGNEDGFCERLATRDGGDSATVPGTVCKSPMPGESDRSDGTGDYRQSRNSPLAPLSFAGWIQTVTVEADGTRTVRLPKENQEIEFYAGGILAGIFEDGSFVCDADASTHEEDCYGWIEAHCWRPIPATPPDELPEFVREVVNRSMWGDMTPGEAARKLLPLFHFPHSPPQVGDERLVVEMWPISRDEHKKGGA